MGKKVSIIMPVYNVEKYIKKSIISVLNQTYDNFELIVVIDGSNDNSANIAKEFLNIDTRVKVVYKKNGGLSDARNYGLKLSNGDYIMFLDSDDYINENLVKECVDFSEKNNLDVTICGFNADFVDNDESLKYRNKIVPKNNIYNRENFNEINIDDKFYNLIGYAWNKLYRASIIKENEVEFIKGLSLIEDIEFNYVIFNNVDRIGFLDKPLYHYIQRNRISLVNSKYTNFYELKLRAAKLRVELLKDWNFDKVFIENEASKLYFSALKSALREACLSGPEKYNKKELNIKNIIKQDNLIQYDISLLTDISFLDRFIIKLIRLKLYKIIYIKYKTINSIRNILSS